MKTIFNRLSIACIVITLGTLFALQMMPSFNAPDFQQFALEKTQSVDFAAGSSAFELMGEDQKLNQVRDWLLYTISLDTGASPLELKESLGAMPAVRYRYLEALNDFDYTEARACEIADGQLIALIPAGKSAEERIYWLSRLADENRIARDKMPAWIYVFEYEIDFDSRIALVTHTEDITGNSLFDIEAGYYEQAIASADDLTKFLSNADCLTYIAYEDGWFSDTLWLGGRRYKAIEYRGLKIDDITRIRRLGEPNYKLALEGKDIAFSLIPTSDAKQQTTLFHSEVANSELGMTLFYTDLLTKLWALDFMRSGSSANFHREILAKSDLPISNLYQQELSQKPNLTIWLGLQNGTYNITSDEPKLLFKPFLTNIQGNSTQFSYRPTTEATPKPAPTPFINFPPYPYNKPPKLNETEIKQDFQPNIKAAEFLDWWRNNAERIARYEPEFTRLNEFYKWNLVFAWLEDIEKSSSFDFLTKQSKESAEIWFSDWAAKNERLKYRSFDAIGLNKGDGKAGALSRERLDAFAFEPTNDPKIKGLVQGGLMLFQRRGGGSSRPSRGGGSSRPSRGGDTGGPSDGTMRPTTISRPTTITGSSGDGSKIFTKNGVKVNPLHNLPIFEAVVIDKNIRLLSSHGEVSPNLTYQKVVSETSIEMPVVVRMGNMEVGRLNVKRSSNGFNVGWQSREFDISQQIARKASQIDEPVADFFARQPEIEAVVKSSDNESAYVKFANSDQWMEVSQSAKVGEWKTEGWSTGVVDPFGGIREIKTRMHTQGTIVEQLEQTNYLSVLSDQGTTATKIEAAYLLPDKTETVQIQTGSGVIPGFKDIKTGRVYFDIYNLPEQFKTNPQQLKRLVDVNSFDSQMAAKIRNGEFDSEVLRLESDLVKYKTEVEANYRSGVDETRNLIQKGDYERALTYLDGIGEVYGRRSELSLMRAVAKLSRDNPRLDSIVKETSASKSFSDQQAFTNEINERIKNGQFIPENEALMLASGSNGVEIHYHLKNQIGGEPINLSEIKGSNILIYVQDAPGLNNINWNVPLSRISTASLSGRSISSFKLLHKDIGSYNPTKIFADNENASFTLVRGEAESNTPVRFRFNSSAMRQNCRTEEDKRNRAECREPSEINPKGQTIIIIRA